MGREALRWAVEKSVPRRSLHVSRAVFKQESGVQTPYTANDLCKPIRQAKTLSTVGDGTSCLPQLGRPKWDVSDTKEWPEIPVFTSSPSSLSGQQQQPISN